MAEKEPDLGKSAKVWKTLSRGTVATWQFYRGVLGDAARRVKEFRDGPKKGVTLEWYDRGFACFLGVIFFICVVIGFLCIPYPTLFDKILDLLKFASLFFLTLLATLGMLFAYLADCAHGSRLHHFERGIWVIPLHIYVVVAWGGIILPLSLPLWYMLP